MQQQTCKKSQIFSNNSLKKFFSNGPDPTQKETGPKLAQNKLGPGFYRAGLSPAAWAGLMFQPETNMDWLLCTCTQ
jgi:hypothetical protein